MPRKPDTGASSPKQRGRGIDCTKPRLSTEYAVAIRSRMAEYCEGPRVVMIVFQLDPERSSAAAGREIRRHAIDASNQRTEFVHGFRLDA